MKLPNINLKKLRKFKKDNFKDRLDFIEKYANWVKKAKNKQWSSQQKKIID